MNSIEYYKEYFSTDIQNVMRTLEHGNRISIHSLISDDATDHFGRTRRAFLETKSPRMFLFCFFYTALIDQAIHSSLRSEHHNFERIAGYPKFAGILSSYWSNMDPSLLLLIATVYIKNENEVDVIKDFSDLTDFFFDDYIDFFQNIFPEYADGLETRNQQNEAIYKVFSEISYSMQWSVVAKGTAIISPNLELYKVWILSLNEKLNKKIAKIPIRQNKDGGEVNVEL